MNIITPKDYRFPWYVRLFFWNQRRRYGAVLEPTRLFSEAAIIELTGLIAFQNMSSKFNVALGVEPQGFCTIAPQQSKGK